MFQYVFWRQATPADPLRNANEARAAAMYQALRKFAGLPGVAARWLRQMPRRADSPRKARDLPAE
ncbi:hypothetical protein C2I36_08625 [Rhodobacteraceae bacterium WD3A24]|nr:hypothetical protein C2I36_08625 [Rhodobacteraceae bacterium WD3A24]